MFSEYLLKQEEGALSNGDMEVLELVFETLKVENIYHEHPEKLHTLARSVLALYRHVSQDPAKLIQILRHPS